MFLQPYFESKRSGRVYVSEVLWRQEVLVGCVLREVEPFPEKVKLVGVYSCESWKDTRFGAVLEEGLFNGFKEHGVLMAEDSELCARELYCWDGGDYISLNLRLYRCSDNGTLGICTNAVRVRR